MATPAEIQALLRFLSKDAKLPLAVAMSKIKTLQEADLTNPQRISQCKAEQLQPVFGDDKTAKQVLSAAKRLGKKRSAAGPADGGDGDAAGPKAKRGRFAPLGGQTPAELEESLGLPEFVVDEAELAGTVLLTNRAPVVLAFGVVLLKYTMPEQPLSSRLSLAQAVVSMNSRSKAVSLGLESGKSAEEEGWGTGQGGAKVLGRSVRTMRRAGWRDAPPAESQESGTVWGDDGDEPPAFWALDLEALKKSSDGTAVNDGTGVGFSSDLPIYTPQSARSYLLKAFERKTGAAETGTSHSKKKATKSSLMAEKERNLALLLGALDLLFKSWSDHLSKDELDSKAWSWYVRVRPDVASGISGWGAKGELRLADILQLRKT